LGGDEEGAEKSRDWGEIGEKRRSGAKEAAEKVRNWSEMPKEHPSGAKEAAEKGGIWGEIGGNALPWLKPALTLLALCGG
jgi:hypothetical protein